jgi:hypothetical protein
MTPPRHDAAVRLSDDDLEAMLERAAEKGARRRISNSGSVHRLTIEGMVERSTTSLLCPA